MNIRTLKIMAVDSLYRYKCNDRKEMPYAIIVPLSRDRVEDLNNLGLTITFVSERVEDCLSENIFDLMENENFTTKGWVSASLGCDETYHFDGCLTKNYRDLTFPFEEGDCFGVTLSNRNVMGIVTPKDLKRKWERQVRTYEEIEKIVEAYKDEWRF